MSFFIFFCTINFSALSRAMESFETATEVPKRKREILELASEDKFDNLERAKLPKLETVLEKSYKVVLVSDGEGKFYRVLPREICIKKAVNETYIPFFFKLPDSNIQAYQSGISELATSVKKMPLFKDVGMMIPEMENGHKMNRTTEHVDRIDRGYIIRNKTTGVCACIYFAIYLDTNICEIERLAVNPNCAGAGLGSSLLEAAMYVASLYGCKRIDLQSTKEAVLTYAKHGFWLSSRGHESKDPIWQDYENLSSDDMLTLAEKFGFLMKINFGDKRHLAKLDKYMNRHIKPINFLSEAILNNLETISQYNDQLDEILDLSEDESSIKLAKEKYNLLSQQISFPEEFADAIFK